jgi:hypothetical protein
MQQPDGVRCDRVSKPGMEFLRYSCAAHDRATFDDTHLQTGAGEVSSAGEAIVARSDDHYVTLVHHRSEMSFRSGRLHSSQLYLLSDCQAG